MAMIGGDTKEDYGPGRGGPRVNADLGRQAAANGGQAEQSEEKY